MVLDVVPTVKPSYTALGTFLLQKTNKIKSGSHIAFLCLKAGSVNVHHFGQLVLFGHSNSAEKLNITYFGYVFSVHFYILFYCTYLCNGIAQYIKNMYLKQNICISISGVNLLVSLEHTFVF